jgi:hypothetical protein
MALDSNGNVFVTGTTATVAYSGQGVPLWTNRYGGEIGAIAVDVSGNVFVSGGDSAAGVVTMQYSSSVSPTLDIQRFDNQLVLSWANAEFNLQSALDLTGLFTNVFGATSPYTNFMTGKQQYFRLKAP